MEARTQGRLSTKDGSLLIVSFVLRCALTPRAVVPRDRSSRPGGVVLRRRKPTCAINHVSSCRVCFPQTSSSSRIFPDGRTEGQGEEKGEEATAVRIASEAEVESRKGAEVTAEMKARLNTDFMPQGIEIADVTIMVRRVVAVACFVRKRLLLGCDKKTDAHSHRRLTTAFLALSGRHASGRHRAANEQQDARALQAGVRDDGAAVLDAVDLAREPARPDEARP